MSIRHRVPFRLTRDVTRDVCQTCDLITSQGQGRATLNPNSVIDATYRRRPSSFVVIHVRHIGGELRSTTHDEVKLRLHPRIPITRTDHPLDDVDDVQSLVFS